MYWTSAWKGQGKKEKDKITNEKLGNESGHEKRGESGRKVDGIQTIVKNYKSIKGKWWKSI